MIIWQDIPVLIKNKTLLKNADAKLARLIEYRKSVYKKIKRLKRKAARDGQKENDQNVE
jgi:hypothetical protein